MSVPQSKEDIIALIKTAAENEQKIEKFKSIIVELKGLYEEKLQKILGELKRFSKENQNLTEELKRSKTRIMELEAMVSSGDGGDVEADPTIDDIVTIRVTLQKMDVASLKALCNERDIELDSKWKKNDIIDVLLMLESGVENYQMILLAEDIKTVLKTLDGLLEKLSDDDVEEFAASKEFKLYDSICEKLEI